MRAQAKFRVKSWDKKPFSEIEDAPKLTRASVTKSCEGDIEGEGTLEYLMVYGDDGTGSFIGVERVVGRVGGRSGSLVLKHTGTFDGAIAKATWVVLPGSATGDLRGMRGEGGFASAHAEEYQMTLEYEFD
jgi:hypothetical protein